MRSRRGSTEQRLAASTPTAAIHDGHVVGRARGIFRPRWTIGRAQAPYVREQNVPRRAKHAPVIPGKYQ